jgi:hypothetical protein
MPPKRKASTLSVETQKATKKQRREDTTSVPPVFLPSYLAFMALQCGHQQEGNILSTLLPELVQMVAAHLVPHLQISEVPV